MRTSWSAAALLASAGMVWAWAAPEPRPKVKADPKAKSEPKAKTDPKVDPKGAAKADTKPAGDPVKAELKFPAGRVDKFTATSRIDQTLTGGALKAPVKTQINQTIDGTLTVVKSDGSGSVVEAVYERVRADMNIRNVRLAYDSQKDKPEAVNPLLMSFAALPGAKLTMRFSSDGKLESLSGMDAVIDKLAKQPNAAEFLETYRSSFGDAAAKREWAEMLTDFLPGKPVRPGETWNDEVVRELAGIGKSALKIQYKLTGADGPAGAKVARIEFAGSGAIAPGGTGMVKVNVSTEQLDQTGSATFDLDRGWVQQRTVQQTGKGTIAVPSSAPMTFDHSYRAELKVVFAKEDATKK